MKRLKPDDHALDGSFICAGPIWHDGCDHTPEHYVCSFEVLHFIHRNTHPVIPRDPVKTSVLKRYDLYVFPSHMGDEVCIRYGNNPEQYISPGLIQEFIFQSHNAHHSFPPDEYAIASRILRTFGEFKWTPREEAKAR